MMFAISKATEILVYLFYNQINNISDNFFRTRNPYFNF